MRKVITFSIMLVSLVTVIIATTVPAMAQITMLEMGVDGMI